MPRTVLVADDSPTIQNKAKGILTGEGLEVVTVSNGVAAIKKLPQIKPELVLADVAMPGRDGYEVCDFVKSSPELRHIPVVLIFSDVDPFNEDQAARVHADGKIQKMASGKPFNPDELISAVTGFLAQAAAAVPLPEQPSMVTEPVDEEPEARTRKGLDPGSLPEGVAFADATTEGELPSPGPEDTVISGLSISDAETSATLDDAPPAGLASAPVEEFSSDQEPVLIEEPAEEQSPLPNDPERTMMFHTPSEIAEPLLNDEVGTGPAQTGPPDLEAELTPEPSATGSYYLTDANASKIRFDSDVSSDSEESPAGAQNINAGAGLGASFDPTLVHSIVQKVVTKMSPPALSPEMIEDMVSRLVGEIMAELAAESS